MSRPTPRRNQHQNQNQNQNHPSPLQDSNFEHNHLGHSYSYSHSHSHSHSNSQSHGHGHGRTRSRQLQDEARHQHQQPHQPHLPTSDYESDTPQYMASHPSAQPAAALASRTNTELNLSVLQRYLRSITTVLSIAANAVVYTFQQPSEWKRTSLEGTMFICSQRKAPGEVGETGCLFILNRKGLQNFVLDLDTVGDFELAGDLLIFKLDHAAHELQLETGEPVRPLVVGLWTYAEDKSDREMNAALITDMWRQALRTREARAQAAASDPATFAALANTGPAAQATGRRLSVSDLFSAYNGNTPQ
ncbi:PH domain-like protein [Nemania abortiva]|nr:PH domain-like protein [Nemania abortiva]